MIFRDDPDVEGGTSGGSGASGSFETPSHPEPHTLEHDFSRDFNGVHLLEVDLRNLSYDSRDFDRVINLPGPHTQESNSSKERDLLLAGSIGGGLSLGRYSTSGGLGLYVIVDLNSKSVWTSLRMGTFSSIGAPGGLNGNSSGGFSFGGKIGPTVIVGFGNANAGFFGPTNSVTIDAPLVSVAVVKTSDYESIQVSAGGSAGVSVERTSSVSGGEINSQDLQRCVQELTNYITRDTGY
ncbi:hypothetical protein GCM10011396_35040 [Undibacterium terreum]|uniref:Uncharacterized protein n=1 Tax=Undibacterium terreum TaxID=1224302 RepID=A0A916URH1_9BURK|nr:hypothetical protein GCM10011396_35040 [Undibacterium terreum]